MKVLLVSLSNRGGGAARAVESLANSLQSKGVEVKALLQEGACSNYHVTILNDSMFNLIKFRLKNKAVNLFMSFFRNDSHDYRSINIFSSSLVSFINKSDADIVNFHWIGAEMISIEQMLAINKPTVWTLHDAWMVNGVYHVSPIDYQPFENNTGDKWLDKWCIKRKQETYSKMNLHLISPSQWIKDRFIAGNFYRSDHTCEVIRNLIDTSVWYPRSKQYAKKRLGFNTDKINVLFLANNINTSFNKGYIFVKQLVELCSDKYVFHFVGTDVEIENNMVNVHGRISDQDLLATYYSAADICVIPSLSENLPYVAVESILCNTPVLCFSTTGLKEIIKTGVNGYCAKKFDINDMFQGLEILSNRPLVNVNRTISDYLPELNLNRYINRYKEVIDIWQNQK